MGKISVRDIVFVSFPFSNLSDTKLRPALVLAYAQKNDWILCQITSKSYSDIQAVRIDEGDFTWGTLERVSYVRPGKLFTASEEVIVKNIAALKGKTHQAIISAITDMLNNGE